MIKGIGTDILEISRFKEVLEKHTERFIRRVYTEDEYNYSMKHKDRMPHLAVRFSAKEAVAKALGCGIGKDLSFQDIIIEKEPSGKPVVRFSEKANEKFKNPRIEISMSHCQKYATATAIWF